MKKAMLFIDGSCIYFDWKKTAPNGKQMDIAKLINKIVSKKDGIELKRSYYYISKLDGNYSPERAIKQDKFLNSLKSIARLDVCYGRLQKSEMNIPNIVCPECYMYLTPHHLFIKIKAPMLIWQ